MKRKRERKTAREPNTIELVETFRASDKQEQQRLTNFSLALISNVFPFRDASEREDGPEFHLYRHNLDTLDETFSLSWILKSRER